MQEALNSIRVKTHSVKDIDVYAHENYVQPLLDYIVDDLRKFRIANNDNTLGGLAVCNSKEQAEMMYRLFLEKYTDESELDNYINEDGAIVYRSKSAGEIEVKKTLLRRDAIVLPSYYLIVMIIETLDSNGFSFSKMERSIC